MRSQMHQGFTTDAVALNGGNAPKVGQPTDNKIMNLRAGCIAADDEMRVFQCIPTNTVFVSEGMLLGRHDIDLRLPVQGFTPHSELAMI